ncbi:MAG: hypothetical protein M0Q95_10935 [Porticoccaceae bacterium]|nr:hypothetical protein [Porticoccaceae bacterium]
MAKQEIQEEIAGLLMKSSVGLTENAIIQQVTGTTNVRAITSALIRMERLGYISNNKKRLTITPVGRSFYSDLNKNNDDSETVDNADHVDDVISGDAVKTYPLSAIAEKEDALPSGIERIDSFRTPDGKIHETSDAAVQHLRKQQQLERINRFVESISSPTKQRNIIIGYITKWERFKQEDAA